MHGEHTYIILNASKVSTCEIIYQIGILKVGSSYLSSLSLWQMLLKWCWHCQLLLLNDGYLNSKPGGKPDHLTYQNPIQTQNLIPEPQPNIQILVTYFCTQNSTFLIAGPESDFQYPSPSLLLPQECIKILSLKMKRSNLIILPKMH